MRCYFSFQILIFMLILSGCKSANLHVERITTPEYPLQARFAGMQGTVSVRLTIGPDGKVIGAKGSGAPDVLVEAAEGNARQWLFGPFPDVAEFPVNHTIQYIYKLQGKPLAVAIPPIIRTFLPNRIEISATPLVSDYPPLEDYKPIPKRK